MPWNAGRMEQRTLGRTGRDVSVVGLGTWQLGADWGDVTEADARAVLEASAEAGVTFYDTADVYGDGRSEQVVGALPGRRTPTHGFTVATKMGRRVDQVPENYTADNFRAWIDRSRAQPRRRHGSTWCSCTARRQRGHRRRRDVRRARRAGRGRRDRGVRRVASRPSTRRCRRSRDPTSRRCRSS